MFSIQPISQEPVHDFGYHTSRGWNVQDDAEEEIEKEKHIHANDESLVEPLKPLETLASSFSGFVQKEEEE